jgi:predicted enzyme related to lactoylglutathione lyase
MRRRSTYPLGTQQSCDITTTVRLLRKIDCVMLHVDDLSSASEFYQRTLGLELLWSNEHSVSLGMPQTDAEIVLHDNPDIPRDCNVHYLVDDVSSAVIALAAAGWSVVVPAFEVHIGRCAILADSAGNKLNLLDITKGPGDHT